MPFLSVYGHTNQFQYIAEVWITDHSPMGALLLLIFSNLETAQLAAEGPRWTSTFLVHMTKFTLNRNGVWVDIETMK